ncbi:MAG: hypothetical protein KFB96_08920 [Thiocapsa sp.]|uniref:DUF6399 domain-containing protein n=1 Tax=Thiocapsa sp. TaxID=2024551 RepID=UPI001BCC4597|nr:DUF6399 domain-containing protein [Thiocapsa sp.]QVL50527.1 MAG: hypothetical protein KFB96_08920 [Thiocapsa sp.]
MTRRTRLEQAEHIAAAEARLAAGETQRAVATEMGIARSTLRDWCGEVPRGDPPTGLTAFARTPEGIDWLHRLVLAAHFSITLRAAGGTRLVSEFLELSGLSAFVGVSDGAQHALNVDLETAVVAVAAEQRTALAEGMPVRQVTVCEDETFHPGICLVAIEPESNLIVLEQYAADRTAATWTAALQDACTGLAVEVIQSTADEAKALRRHAETDLRAQHSPDLFHGQHEVSKATSLALARDVRRAEAGVAAAQKHWEAERAAQQAFEARVPRPLGRPPAFETRIGAALSALVAVEAERDRARERQSEARALIRELGVLYHPYDPVDGQTQPVERVAARFTDVWTRLKGLAEAAELPERARERLAKAERLTVQWLATLAFFFATVTARVEALALSPELEAAVLEQLIPGIYLERVAARSTAAETRHRVQAASTALLDVLRRADHPLQRLAPEDSARVEQVAGACADLFQRSSSCVEGRNGQLSLHHHGRHRLSDRRLAALTAVHNFHIRRPDGTTAAERFFGRTHPALFEELLLRVPLPPRPRRRRPRPPKLPYLMPVAA